MATTKITEQTPSLAAVALDLTQNCPWLGKVSASDVAASARRRGVALKDGRVPHSGLADIYFDLMHERTEQ